MDVGDVAKVGEKVMNMDVSDITESVAGSSRINHADSSTSVPLKETGPVENGRTIEYNRKLRELEAWHHDQLEEHVYGRLLTAEQRKADPRTWPTGSLWLEEADKLREAKMASERHYSGTVAAAVSVRDRLDRARSQVRENNKRWWSFVLNVPLKMARDGALRGSKAAKKRENDATLALDLARQREDKHGYEGFRWNQAKEEVNKELLERKRVLEKL